MGRWDDVIAEYDREGVRRTAPGGTDGALAAAPAEDEERRDDGDRKAVGVDVDGDGDVGYGESDIVRDTGRRPFRSGGR